MMIKDALMIESSYSWKYMNILEKVILIKQNSL